MAISVIPCQTGLLSLRRGGRSFAETSGSRSAELRCSMLALPAQLPGEFGSRCHRRGRERQRSRTKHINKMINSEKAWNVSNVSDYCLFFLRFWFPVLPFPLLFNYNVLGVQLRHLHGMCVFAAFWNFDLFHMVHL